MSETTEKALWIKSPLSNKIGTILWGISAILVIFTFTNLLTMGNLFSKLLENDAVAVQSDFLKFSLILTLPFFVIFTVLSIGMFLGSNTCTALAKSYGISLLIFDIAIILGVALLISIIAPVIAGAFAPLEVFLSSFTGFFDQIKSLINSIDEETIKQFEIATKEIANITTEALNENPELLNNIYQEYIGNIDPKIVDGAIAAIKFMSSLICFSIFTVLFNVFCILGSFMLKINSAEKNRTIALVLCLFMGLIGGHLLYVGRTGKAIFRIICLVTIILAFIPIILCIFDLFKIILGKFLDKEKQPVINWK